MVVALLLALPLLMLLHSPQHPTVAAALKASQQRETALQVI